MSQTQLEKCLECIIDIFHKYSIQKEHHDRISKAEFAKLLKEQLPNFIQNSRAGEGKGEARNGGPPREKLGSQEGQGSNSFSRECSDSIDRNSMRTWSCRNFFAACKEANPKDWLLSLMGRSITLQPYSRVAPALRARILGTGTPGSSSSLLPDSPSSKGSAPLSDSPGPIPPSHLFSQEATGLSGFFGL
ncbi:hypothetical protein L345_18191, partial [Ophiophagus hannah]